MKKIKLLALSLCVVSVNSANANGVLDLSEYNCNASQCAVTCGDQVLRGNGALVREQNANGSTDYNFTRPERQGQYEIMTIGSNETCRLTGLTKIRKKIN